MTEVNGWDEVWGLGTWQPSGTRPAPGMRSYTQAQAEMALKAEEKALEDEVNHRISLELAVSIIIAEIKNEQEKDSSTAPYLFFLRDMEDWLTWLIEGLFPINQEQYSDE